MDFLEIFGKVITFASNAFWFLEKKIFLGSWVKKEPNAGLFETEIQFLKKKQLLCGNFGQKIVFSDNGQKGPKCWQKCSFATEKYYASCVMSYPLYFTVQIFTITAYPHGPLLQFWYFMTSSNMVFWTEIFILFLLKNASNIRNSSVILPSSFLW